MKRFLLLSFLVLAGFLIRAQNGNRLEALKIAYITNKLNLSPQEAERFWPIYNQYAAELKQARQQAIKNNSSEIELDESTLNIRKKYSTQFSQVISPQKVDMLFKSEKEVARFVQKEMERRQFKNQKMLEQNP